MEKIEMPPRKKTVEVHRPSLELSAIERARMISLKEAARLRGVSEDTIRRMAMDGSGPKIYELSPNRRGCRLGEVLDI
jgi:hypothetical protein